MILDHDEINQNCYSLEDLPTLGVNYPQLSEELEKTTGLKVKEFRHFTKICLKVLLTSYPDGSKRDSIFYEKDFGSGSSIPFLEGYFLGSLRRLLKDEIGPEKTEKIFKIYLEKICPKYEDVFLPIFERGKTASQLAEKDIIHQTIKNHIPEGHGQF